VRVSTSGLSRADPVVALPEQDARASNVARWVAGAALTIRLLALAPRASNVAPRVNRAAPTIRVFAPAPRTPRMRGALPTSAALLTPVHPRVVAVLTPVPENNGKGIDPESDQTGQICIMIGIADRPDLIGHQTSKANLQTTAKKGDDPESDQKEQNLHQN